MHAVPHSIGLESLEDGVSEDVTGRDVGKGQRVRGIDESIEVWLQLNGVPVGDAQAFPDGVPALNHAVQHMDAGLVTGHKAVDPALGAGVAGIGSVEFGH